MVRRASVFSGCILAFALSCYTPMENLCGDRLHCLVLDVENGLAQIIYVGDNAVAIDLGEEKYCSRWLDSYEEMGSPYLDWICISHTDEDHVGGIRSLPRSVSFSGIVYVGALTDTALLRSYVSHLDRKISFHPISRGDVLRGPGQVKLTCLWPPAEPLEREPGEATATNRYSLCFRVDYKGTSFLITSDIDSSSMRTIAYRNSYNLDTDWIVVPHHGSGSSLQADFYSLASPRRAVISCGKKNNYNHPSSEVTRFLTTHLRIPIDITASCGDVRFASNGYYWDWE